MAENLNSYLSKASCFCLNEDTQNTHKNLFNGSGLPLTSNADEQLLLHLSMNQTVKLNQIRFNLPQTAEAPHTVKLFSNKVNIGFEEANGRFYTSC